MKEIQLVVTIKTDGMPGVWVKDKIQEIAGSDSVTLGAPGVRGWLAVEVTGVLIDDPVTVGGTPFYEIEPVEES